MRGYRIRWVTLQLLFLVHFVLPFIVMLIMICHLIILHKRERTRLIYSYYGVEKVTFYPYYWVKDIINLVIYIVFLVVMLLFPYALGEVELFEEANFLNSPVHIVPEWYFCARYAILRSVPSKSMGVLIIILKILVLFLYPLRVNYITPSSNEATPMWVRLFVLQAYLTYLGLSPIR